MQCEEVPLLTQVYSKQYKECSSVICKILSTGPTIGTILIIVAYAKNERNKSRLSWRLVHYASIETVYVFELDCSQFNCCIIMLLLKLLYLIFVLFFWLNHAT
jgi:membrane-associated HD superfamily phosphohydrolase